jgi:hypothetical protein
MLFNVLSLLRGLKKNRCRLLLNQKNYSIMQLKNTKQPFIVILFFVLMGMSMGFTDISLSQEGKIYDGFVIMISGDTLEGKLEMLSPTMNQVKIKFIDEDGEKVLYRAKDLKAYAFKVEVWNKKINEKELKWIYYTKKIVERPPIPFASTEVLLQQEVVGNISIYNFYVETRVEQYMEHIVYVEKNEVLYEVNKENYKVILNELMGDLPFMKNKVGTKNYMYNNLEETIMEYNQQLKKGVEIGEK